MIKIYYNLKPGARGRQVDAALYPPPNTISVLPENWKVTKEGGSLKKPNPLIPLINMNFFLINEKKVPENINADIIYAYGTFIKNSKIPYVVDTDNPACFTYYGPLALKNPIVKYKIKKILENEKLLRLIPMSKACRTSLINTFGDYMEEKIEVIYPPFPSLKIKKETENEVVKFIFISYNFWIKGGREILNAVKKLKGKYEVTMVTNPPPEYDKEIKKRWNEYNTTSGKGKTFI